MGKKIEEVILEELGITLRREIEGGGNDEIIAVLKKYDKWFKSIAQRIKQQDQQIQQLINAGKTGGDPQTVVVPPVGEVRTRIPTFKCHSCGTILQYVTNNICPVCGANKVERA